jgi:hypothetical protein
VQTADEFNELMEKVDKKLRDQGVSIAARPLLAVREISMALGVGLRIAPLSSGPEPGIYEGDSLSAHIKVWFESRYGDRLKMNPSPRYTVVLLAGDLWRVRLPLLYGRPHLVVDPNGPLVSQTQGRVFRRGPVTINVLTYVEGLTRAIALTLEETESSVLLNHFMTAMDTRIALHEVTDRPYIVEALGDLEASGASLTAQRPHAGQSMWSSLQAAEKVLKSYAVVGGGRLRKSHNLTQVFEEAQAVGLPTIAAGTLQTLQCSADVRYGADLPGIERAVAAHQSAYEICKWVGEALRDRPVLDK